MARALQLKKLKLEMHLSLCLISKMSWHMISSTPVLMMSCPQLEVFSLQLSGLVFGSMTWSLALSWRKTLLRKFIRKPTKTNFSKISWNSVVQKLNLKKTKRSKSSCKRLARWTASPTTSNLTSSLKLTAKLSKNMKLDLLSKSWRLLSKRKRLLNKNRRLLSKNRRLRNWKKWCNP